MGPNGRGVCDYFSISPSKVDILMGTLTKSFGATGGYIAGSQEVIDYLKLHNMANVAAEPTAPPVLAQIQESLKTITGEICPGEGKERLERLAFNSRYLRLGLKKMGFIVSGLDDSPIIPVMLYQPPKMPAFSRMMLERGIAVVVVGYPATPLPSSRVRFCVSSALTKSDLDRLLKSCDEVGDILNIKMSGERSKRTGELFREHFESIVGTLVTEAKQSWADL
jgi:serine palmitoyltransferase